MYTLRLFKNVNEINRTQIYLGTCYTVKEPSEQDKKESIILRVYGDKNNNSDQGYAIYYDDNAFIMMPTGDTFETLNRPRN